MGTITTGTGLVSGIDIAGLVDQLMAIEERPKQLIEQRNAVLTAQQTALQDVNSRLLALKFNVDSLTGSTTFNATTATTSNENVLTVSSGAGAVPGNYSFTVDKLVQSQQVLTKGFKDIDDTSVGSGTLTFEKGNARLDSKTRLADLNGGAGVERGLIRVTDRSGAVGLIDLSRAVTVDDAILAINSATNVSVRATVTGDGLTITDNTGLGSGDLTITNAGLSDTASSLGIAGTDSSGAITGTQINVLGDDTALAFVNDGQGVDIRSDNVAEFTITDGGGTDYDINLLNETTLGEVVDTINAATGGVVVAAIAADGVSLTLTDSSGGAGTLSVAAGSGSSTAASDLGLVGADDDGDSVLGGNRIVSNINSRLLTKLNGGDGIGNLRVLSTSTPLADLFDGAGVTTAGLKELVIFDRNGSGYTIDLDPSTTAGDLIGLVDAGTGGNVTMSISGNSFVLTDNTGGAGNLRAYDNPGSGSTIVADLGLTVDAAVISFTGADTFPVATEQGAGSINITDRDGTLFTVDMSSAKSVSDVIDGINDAADTSGAGISASLNRAGNGIKLTDSTGGSGDIIVADVDSTTAEDLGLLGTFSDDEVDSGNLQYQYMTLGTRLDTIGFVAGNISITDSTGDTATVSFQQGEATIADILQDINGAGLEINARINDNGDGIIIEDTNTGTQSVAISVEESGSSTAASLGLLGAASAAGEDFDGSFETTVEYTSDAMTGATLLSALKSGNGIDYEASAIDFTITTTDGTEYDIDLTAGITTVQELIDLIHTTTSNNVTVAINEDGNRLQVTDNAGGAGRLLFESKNSSEALGDLGFDDADVDNPDFSKSSKLVSDTTLGDLVDLINESDAGVSAAVINDGSSGTPYRMIFSSDTTGSAGAFVFDDGGAGFKASTFSEAQDAVVFYGSSNPAVAQIITSTSNTLEDVIPGASIDLLSTSDTPVQVTVSEDNAAVTAAATAFVEGFNGLMDTIDTYDSYNAETEERGLLLGDSAVIQLKNQLFASITRQNSEVSGTFNSLAEVGITVGSGGTLRLDSSKLTNALATDREAVKNLFTFKTTETDEDGETVTTARGVGIIIDDLLERLTDTDTGIIESRVATLTRQMDLNNDRIETIDEALAARRARLEAQFLAMEQALAGLQEQSSALASLQALGAQAASSVGG